MSRLRELKKFGQSLWLDYISRDLLTSGELRRLIDEDGLAGLTSNPTIFEKAISGSEDYDGSLGALLQKNPTVEIRNLYESLAIEDIRTAADILRPVYDETQGSDGFVSLEAAPDLAYDAEKTLAEVRRLWKAVDKPNLMVKVPSTPQGVTAVEQLISEGININITLMFSMAHYEAVANAYIRGLERCANRERVNSVASFFVSRVDTLVDKELEKLGTSEALAMRGKTAIANTKAVYRRFQEIFHGEPFSKLKRRGCRVQRPLWGSTSTKNPSYRDVLYVEELIGPETVNTVPPATIDAFRDHGEVRGPTVEEKVEEADRILQQVKILGVNLDDVTEKLQRDGVKAFADSFHQLLSSLEKKRRAMIG